MGSLTARIQKERLVSGKGKIDTEGIETIDFGWIKRADKPILYNHTYPQTERKDCPLRGKKETPELSQWIMHGSGEGAEEQ